MPSDESISEDWLSFTCHFCRAKLRIREKYAHLRGRCPDCGIRIEALRPQPYERPVGHSSDEPVGLTPLGAEEWPEPALHDQPEPSYELVKTPLPFTDEEKPDSPGSTDIARFADAEPAAEPVKKAAASEDAEGTYQLTPALPPPALPPIAEIAPFQLSEAERKPIRTPAPPAKPLLQGVFDFPWQPGNRRVWALQAIGFAVLTFIPAMIHMFYEQLGTGAFYLAVAFMGVGVLMVLLITGSYASSWFLDILEQTANGCDQITWTDIAWRDGLVMLLRLGWVFIITLALPVFLLSALGLNSLLAFLLFAPVIVPIGLLSVGSAPAWSGTSFEVVRRLGVRRQLFFTLYLQTLPIWGVCATAYNAAISWIDFRIALWLTPLVGLLLSAGVMIYARLLGRVGMVLTQPEKKAKKKRKRKKKPPEESGTDAVEEGEGERPEDQDRQPRP